MKTSGKFAGLIAAVLVMVLLVTACGPTASDTSPGDDVLGTTREPGGDAGPVEIELSAENTMFDKDTITVPAGAHVVMQFTNMDEAGHNFAAYEDDSMQNPIYVGEIIEGPDQTVTYEFDAPATPGTYYFQCDPHAAEMNGQFIVE